MGVCQKKKNKEWWILTIDSLLNFTGHLSILAALRPDTPRPISIKALVFAHFLDLSRLLAFVLAVFPFTNSFGLLQLANSPQSGFLCFK